MMNSCVLIGRITKDIELKRTQSGTACTTFTLQSGTACTTFTLAVNRVKEGADFITVLAWGNTAEVISKYCYKGFRLGVKGHIETGSYEREGRTIYTTQVVAESVEFLEPKKKDDFGITEEDIEF